MVTRLQKEIREGKVEVHKVLGIGNPADLMTKVLSVVEIEDRLRGMSSRMVMVNGGKQMVRGQNVRVAMSLWLEN